MCQKDLYIYIFMTLYYYMFGTEFKRNNNLVKQFKARKSTKDSDN